MHELNGFGIEINNYFDVSLSVYVANEIKRRKTELKEKGDAKKLEEKLINEQYNQLKEEFGL